MPNIEIAPRDTPSAKLRRKEEAQVDERCCGPPLDDQQKSERCGGQHEWTDDGQRRRRSLR